MFEPQNGSSSEEVDFSMAQGQQETEETEAERTIPSIAPWPITNSASAAIARFCLKETENICWQEMAVLGDRL